MSEFDSAAVDDSPKMERIVEDDASSWSGFINSLLLQAAKDPYTFLFYVLVFLSPFFLASAVLSYKLSRAIEKQEKDMKKKKGPAPKRPKKDQ